jgi:putative acetyltransferase
MQIRLIQPADNPRMAAIIRQVMTEFNCVGPGFSIEDPEVDHLSEAYAPPAAAYFVLIRDGAPGGGAGYAPLEGGDPGICELRKMYILPSLRGRGAGQALLDACLAGARDHGYRAMYLETVHNMARANRLYRKNGFQPLDEPLGRTGHDGCDAYYLRPLQER